MNLLSNSINITNSSFGLIIECKEKNYVVITQASDISVGYIFVLPVCVLLKWKEASRKVLAQTGFRAAFNLFVKGCLFTGKNNK